MEELVNLIETLVVNPEYIVYFLLGLIIFLGIGFWLLFLRKPVKAEWKDKIAKKYKELIAKDLEKKYLLIELDKLAESALQSMFGLNKSFGDILKMKSKNFDRKEINQIWAAHKIRNKLVHDIDYTPSQNELNHSIIVFKRLIKELTT